MSMKKHFLRLYHFEKDLIKKKVTEKMKKIFVLFLRFLKYSLCSDLYKIRDNNTN